MNRRIRVQSSNTCSRCLPSTSLSRSLLAIDGPLLLSPLLARLCLLVSDSNSEYASCRFQLTISDIAGHTEQSHKEAYLYVLRKVTCIHSPPPHYDTLNVADCPLSIQMNRLDPTNIRGHRNLFFGDVSAAARKSVQTIARSSASTHRASQKTKSTTA